GNHVEMAVEDHARDLVGRRADGRDQHRQRVVLVILHLDVAGFEPPLDESCGRNQLLSTGGVVGDQALSQYALVYHREELTVRRLAAPPACRESTVPQGRQAEATSRNVSQRRLSRSATRRRSV